MSGYPVADGRLFQRARIMTDWTETYRGAVPPWQCDVTEHFTVAYYFDRLEEAAANLADELGLGDVLRAGGFPRRFDVRYARELRAGACFHVESAVIGIENGLRLGHRFVDSATRETVTWFDEHWDLPETLLTSERIATWDGPEVEQRPEPTSTAGFIPTARGRVKPGDLDPNGVFSLSAFVHRFSTSSGQTGAAIGFDTGYMEQHRRGFSTFELALRISGVLRLDEPYLVETGIAHLGNSSLRMIHRMTDPRTGAEVARLGQFGVNLDLDARRPARWPEDIRARASALVIPVG
jgi:acyl-CoA thioesterase FadM